jgi:AcrR family transcriptional regulator
MTEDVVARQTPSPPDQARRTSTQALDTRSVTERILDGAETVLRRHGFAGFSTRRVADEAAIAVGNLTYHFPTKPELVRALIGRLTARYLNRLQEMLGTAGRDVESLVRWLLEEAVTESAWLFRELWAMALHDRAICDAVDDLYDELMAKVTATLAAAYPEANPQGVRDLVQFIALMSEGSAILYGTRRTRATSHERMIDLAVRLTTVIAPELTPTRADPG